MGESVVWWTRRKTRQQATREAEEKRIHQEAAAAAQQREDRRQERERVEAEARQQYGDRASVWQCHECGECVVDLKPEFQPGEIARAIEPPLWYQHARYAHRCTCGPDAIGFCQWCRTGIQAGWIAFNFDVKEAPDAP